MTVQGSSMNVSMEGQAQTSEGKLKDHSGFTLVEILIVVALMAILLAGAMILYRQWNDKYRVESEIREIHSILMKARNDAANSNTRINVSLATNQVSVHHDTNGDGVVDPGEAFSTNTYPSFNLNFAVSPIVFDRRGLTTNIQTISITGYAPNASPGVDCVVLAPTRINIGLMTGGACVEQ